MIGIADARALPLPDSSVHAIATDPPYGIGFMGHQWDQPGEYAATSTAHGYGKTAFAGESHPAMEAGRYDVSRSGNARFQAWCTAWATEALRVLKPGGWMLAFGGTRTWHRLTSGIEDAGFEIRDDLMRFWLYSQGFPKSLDADRAIDMHLCELPGRHYARTLPPEPKRRPDDHVCPDTPAGDQWAGWGTALKPGYEPIVVARKPLAGTVAANVLEHGTGALNIDGSRVGEREPQDYTVTRWKPGATLNAEGGTWKRQDPGAPTVSGTLPAARWPANVVLDEEVAALLDQQSGTLVSGANPTRRGTDKFRDVYNEFPGQEACVPARGIDQGGASRFFYTAKADADERVTIDGQGHPTVKPLELMRWLVRLVTPPGGLVLDPFAGSGTTGEAAMLEGFRFLLLDNDPEAWRQQRIRTHPYVRRRKVITAPVGPEQGSLL